MTRPILEGFLNQLHDNTPNLLASTIVSVDGIALAWLLSRQLTQTAWAVCRRHCCRSALVLPRNWSAVV